MFYKTINIFKLSFLLFIFLSKVNYCQVIYPTTISGLECWYSADSGVVLNGSNVFKIMDLSPNHHDITQSTVSSQPTILNNQLNGKKSINFDSFDDYLAIVDSINFKTVIIIAKANEAVFSDYRGLLGGPAASTFPGGYLINANSGTTKLGLGVSPVGFSKIKRNNTDITSTGDFNPINNFWVGLFEYNSIRKQTADIGRIDNGTQPGRYWKGDIAEIIVYNKDLSANELTTIENYISKKYTTPVNLGPDINVTSNSFCNTTLTTTLGYSQYLWSNGATTPTISVNQPGKYWVRIVNDFDFYSYDTISLSYSNFKQLKKDTMLCLGSEITWDTQLSKSNYTFFWQDNSVDSIFTINQAGNYYVKITDSFSCSITSDTVKISVDNFSTSISLGPDVSLCSGNSITLTSGANSSLSYTWSTGSNNDSLLITTSGQYSIAVTNTNNCVAKDTIDINVLGQAPTANFSFGIGCFNSAVSFTNFSIPPSGNTITNSNWNFGDPLSPSNTSTLSNTFHTFSDTGTYSINLKVYTNVGCENTITKTIHIAPTPTINFSNGISCQNDSTVFSSSITSSPGYSITSTSWNFGDPISGIANTSNLLSPKHLFSNQTTYSVTLIATNNIGCATSLTKSIIVKGQVIASFTNSPPCSNTAVIFQDNSTVPIPSSQFSRLWNFGTSTTTGLTASKTYTSSGVYSVTLTVTGTGTNNCSSKISKQILVFQPPAVNFTVPPFCSKDTITATNQSVSQSGFISSYNWKLNNTYFSSVQNPTLTASAGTYSVKLIVSNTFNCKDSLTKPITVLSLPNVDFTTNLTSYYYINSPINFIPNITNANSYLWNITSIPTSTIQSPTVSFNTEGSYTISLNLQDQQGCKNSKTKTITVSKHYLDLAVLNVKTVKDNDGFITVEADIANYGSVPVTSFDIHYQISDAGNIKETWNGILNPNAFYVYTFNAKSATQKNKSNNITCVEIEKANTIIDENINNNTICNTLNIDEISVSNPLPNPTDSDITLPIILNNDMDFTIAIYNSTGQRVYEETTQKGTTGLNFITLPTSVYSRGCYIIKTAIDGKIFIKKFIISK